MSLFELLPYDVLYLILDYFAPTNFKHDYKRAMPLVHLARVNRFFSKFLLRDEPYQRWWQRHISKNLPTDMYRDIHDISSRYYGKNLSYSSINSQLRIVYFYLLYRVECSWAICHAIEKGYEIMFETVYAPTDFVGSNELEYRGTNRRIDVFFEDAIRGGRMFCIEKFLNTGVFTDKWKSHIFEKQLILAIQSHRTEIVKLMMEGFPQHLSEPYMSIAIRCGNLNAINYLLQRGESVNEQSIRLALESSCYAIVERFIELGLDPKGIYKLALTYPSKYSIRDVDELLLKAITRGDIECAKTLLEAGVSAAGARHKAKPLYEAARRGYLEMVRVLFNYEVNHDTMGVACAAAIRGSREARDDREKVYDDIVRVILSKTIRYKIAKDIYKVAVENMYLNKIKLLADEFLIGAEAVMEHHKPS